MKRRRLRMNLLLAIFFSLVTTYCCYEEGILITTIFLLCSSAVAPWIDSFGHDVTVQAFAIPVRRKPQQTCFFINKSPQQSTAITSTTERRRSTKIEAKGKLLLLVESNRRNKRNVSAASIKKIVTAAATSSTTTTTRNIRSLPQKNNKEKNTNGSSRKKNPPWLPDDSSNRELLKAQAKYNLYVLEQALEKHAKCSCPHGSFTSKDIDIVIDAVLVASKNDYRLILGACDFLTLLLSVEDYNASSSSSSCENVAQHDVISENVNDMDNDGDLSGYYAVMTRDALVASAFHYCDCVLARDAGIYEIINDWMRSTSTARSRVSGEEEEMKKNESQRNNKFLLKGDSDERNGQCLLLPSLAGQDESGSSCVEKFQDDEDASPSSSTTSDWDLGVTVDVGGTTIDEFNKHSNATMQDVSKNALVTADAVSIHDMDVQSMNHSYSIESYGEDVVGLSQSLARVKQAEIMSHSLLPSKFSRVSPSPADAASIRGLLLSMSENWRALAIRSSASLYRLRGLLRHEQQARLRAFGGNNGAEDEWVDGYSRPQLLREAREAMYVYAPLAGRLGMHRLKGELENTAFMVLYHRQYDSAMGIYERSGSAIQSVTDFLSENIEMVLKNDDWLSPQLERLTVMSRVKKPYSLWRKLLKVKKRSNLTLRKMTPGSSISLVSDPNAISITSVQDAIAIRVIVKAKRSAKYEKDKDVRSREEFLCYYIQNRLMQIWPAMNANRIKDYISNPKPNGYQSLHHTSQCFRYGHYWPFEVQIRTEDMHTKSEYGVAAHWDYKLKGLGRGKKNEPHIPLLDTAMEMKQDSSETDQRNYISTIETIIRDTNSVTSILAGKDRGIGSLTRSSALKSYIQALSTAREHLLDKSVFVFYLTLNSDSMEGKVLGLPVGSTVYDALLGICKRCNLTVPPDSFDDSKFDAFVNGAKASLHDSLNTGDTLVFPSLESRVVKYL